MGYNRFMKIRERIIRVIEGAVEEMSLEESRVEIEHPADENNGDYACNVAMLAYKEAEEIFESPRELAEALVKEIRKNEALMKRVEKVEVAGAGFINFYLRQRWLIDELGRVVEKGRDYGRGNWGGGKKVLVEYSSPNIAKRFNVGHLRSTIIGQALMNLYKFSGWETVGDNHLGDWGTQFGIIIMGIEEEGVDVEKMSLVELEELYVRFNKKVEEDEILKKKAQEAFARLEGGEKKTREVWQKVKETSMKEFEKIYDRLGVEIEHCLGESFYEDKMERAIDELEKKGLVRDSEGARIVEFNGLPPAMLVKSNGTSTYFTRDLAAVKYRTKTPKLASDLYIYEVGAEQSLHFKQVFATARKAGWVKKGQLIHVGHGLVLGDDGKRLRTRSGNGSKLNDLLDEVVTEAGKIKKEVAEEVGVGAVKFYDLKHNPITNYKFDQKQMVSLEGASGPYVQYAIVRGKAVLAQGGEKNVLVKESDLVKEEERVARLIYRFSEVIERATRERSPNLVCEYLLELASRFNSFYNQQQILGSDREALRLRLTKATVGVMENGMRLLGVSVPERM